MLSAKDRLDKEKARLKARADKAIDALDSKRQSEIRIRKLQQQVDKGRAFLVGRRLLAPNLTEEQQRVRGQLLDEVVTDPKEREQLADLIPPFRPAPDVS